MTDLLSRLQSATGPSRALDAEIALANGWTQGSWEIGDDFWQSPTGQICLQPPRYTESIDTVLTLVPEAAEYQVGSAKLVGKFWTSVITPKMEYKATAATPAIALLIAIMRAKEDSKP